MAVIKEKRERGAVVKEVDIPKVHPNEVLIEIQAASICGTDRHIYLWDTDFVRNKMKPPLVFGHECSGKVVEIGDNVGSVCVGDYVSTETHIACGHCYQCRIGLPHICKNVQLIGVTVPGIFAKYAAVPATNIWKNDPKLPPEVAAAQEPLGNAVHTVFSGDVAGKTVAVFGCGPIGICAVALCNVVGAEEVFAVEKKEYRLKLAAKMGAKNVIDSSNTDPVEEIKKATHGVGVDVFLEVAGGDGEALRQGLEVLRPGGRASILGIFTKPVTVDFTKQIVEKAITVHGIYGRLMYETWYRTTSFLRSGKIELSKLITHRFNGLENFDEAMEPMLSGECGKIVIFP